jgi:hypothetical protein
MKLHTSNITDCTTHAFSSLPDYQLAQLKVKVILRLAGYRQSAHLGV